MTSARTTNWDRNEGGGIWARQRLSDDRIKAAAHRLRQFLRDHP
jgi:hypothetical protein